MHVLEGGDNTVGNNVLCIKAMATVKRTAIAGGYFIELGSKEIEIYSIATDGSGALKRVDDVQGTIRMLTEQAGMERDYNQSFRQHVARLIQHINNEENKKE